MEQFMVSFLRVLFNIIVLVEIVIGRNTFDWSNILSSEKSYQSTQTNLIGQVMGITTRYSKSYTTEQQNDNVYIKTSANLLSKIKLRLL